MHQEAYDSAPGLRRSDLWKIHISPYHFKTAMDTPEGEPSAALTFGIAVHKLILEPNDFFNEYAIAPTVDKRTKAGKETWQNFLDMCASQGKEAIDENTYMKIQEMSAAVSKNQLATAMLNGPHEQEYYWTDPITGEALKCKCDAICQYDGKNYIVDYKTTDSCEDGHFESSVRKYGYQFQTGFYTEGLKECTGTDYGFAFIAQEKKPPYACRIYICSDAFIEKGKMVYHQLLGLYHKCALTDDWFGYEGEATNPKPTILLDDAERYAANRQIAPRKQGQLYTSLFKSDDYLEYDEPTETDDNGDWDI